ncbi:Transformer-2 -like protein beta [Trichinella nativa]|uniref:Transformer-2-like protein beta n=1 Tax=Trichinella nativa TaxID=6335 RepID=A0A0V1KV96_9BILA|nr:Transformer-2 -like protein beta [Trichinella nativa]
MILNLILKIMRKYYDVQVVFDYVLFVWRFSAQALRMSVEISNEVVVDDEIVSNHHSANNRRSRTQSRSSTRTPSRSRSFTRSRTATRSRTRSRSRDRRRNKRSRSSSRDRRRRRSRTRSISRSRSRDRGRHGRRRSKSRSPMSNRKRHLAPRENPPTSRCLGVFGLSLYTTERDLHQLFSRYGKVDDVQLVYDHPSGRSRGFGFVYFDTVDDAVLARERAAGTEIDGHRIRIDFSITKRPHTPTPVAEVTEMIIIVEGRHRRTIIVAVHVRTPTVLDCCTEKTLSEVIEAVMVEGAFGSCALHRFGKQLGIYLKLVRAVNH